MSREKFAKMVRSSIERAAALRKFSNQALCQSSRDTITQHLRDAEHDIQCYDSEIDRLESIIISLESEQEQIAETAKTCKGLLAPVRRLPSEIIKEIMLWTRPKTEVVLNPKNFRSTPPPPALVLSMVCGSWRNVALYSPELWSVITISRSREVSLAVQKDPAWEGKPARKILRAIKMLLSRSGSHPLDLEFSLDKVTKFNPNLNKIFEAFAAESKRWRSVVFHRRPSFIQHPALIQIQSNMPILRKLGLPSMFNSSPSTLDYFQSCPVLECIETNQVTHPLQDLPFATLPWANIQDLKTSVSHTGPSMQDILRSCQRLRSLTISTDDRRISFPQHLDFEHPVESPVESLSFYIHRHLDNFAFVNVFIRRLHTLTLVGDPYFVAHGFSWEERHLAACLERSSPNITCFSISHVPFRDIDALQLLQHMPSLRKFHVVDFDGNKEPKIITSRFSVRLCIEPPADSESPTSTLPPLVPRLTELAITVGSIGFDAESLSRCIISRWLQDPEKPNVEQLKYVEVLFLNGGRHTVDKPPDKVLSARLKEYKDAGLQISVVPFSQ